MAAGICAPIDPLVPDAEMDAFPALVRPALVIADTAGLALHRSAFARYGVRVACAEDGAEHAAGVFDLIVAPTHTTMLTDYVAELGRILRSIVGAADADGADASHRPSGTAT